MKIENGTAYPTRLLRTLVTRAYRFIARTEGRLPQWSRVRFKVRRRITRSYNFVGYDGVEHHITRGGHTSGYAYIGGAFSVLTLPCPEVDSAAVVSLAWHEIYHLYGYRHGAYQPHPDDEALKNLTADLPATIREVEPAWRPKADVRETRQRLVVEAIARWESKLRRAERALRRLRARRRYYEKALQKAAAPKGKN